MIDYKNQNDTYLLIQDTMKDLAQKIARTEDPFDMSKAEMNYVVNQMVMTFCMYTGHGDIDTHNNILTKESQKANDIFKAETWFEKRYNNATEEDKELL